MRLTVFIILVSAFQILAVTSYSQKTRLSLSFHNAPLEQVLDEIENISEFYFLFNQKTIDVNRKVDISVEDQKINEILDGLFKDTDVGYLITNRQIILNKDDELNDILYQQAEVRGKVTDLRGQPMPGVTVVVVGTTVGVVSDSEGNYTIKLPENAEVLKFSFVGMKTLELPIEGRQLLNVTMEEETIGIDEVVAIGYGTQKKATVTGSIATVKGDDLAKIPSTNLGAALTGKMTGVIVNSRGSSPGNENIQINIRGKSSWEGGSPLIIIDGIANRSGFERINPNDIESISVLKDASAAIYGSRAANGVILITTKRGKEGKPTIEYTGDFGLTQPTRIPDMARSWQFANYYTEAQRNGFIFTDEEIQKYKLGADPNLYPNYDIKDYMLQDFAPQTTHTISLRGGNEAVKYYVSGRYLFKDSYFKEGIDNFNSYNVRSNIDATVSKNLHVSVDINGRRDDIRRAVGSGSTYDQAVGYSEIGFFDYMLAIRPTSPIFYVNGLPASIFDNNVVETIRGKGGEKNDLVTAINTQASARWDLPFITEGLFLEGTAAYDFTNTRTKEFSKSYDLYAYDNSTGEYSNLNVTPVMSRGLYDYYYNSYKYTLNGKLGYEKVFDDHSINTFVAYEQYSINTEWINATRSSFLSDKIPYLFAGDANTQKNDGSGYEFAYRNFFGRFAYTYKEKYLLDFTLRRDESLKFSEDNRVGWFPGISVGWRISEEPFMAEKFPTVDNLKLRASYGQMGSDNVGDYQYLATAKLQDAWGSYVLGANPSVVSTLYFTGTPNPAITWEVANSYNLALEGSVKQGLLGFELEYFYSKRSNILATRNASVPVYAGMSLPDENIGEAQNQGIELMLSHRKQIGEFAYSVSGNFTYTANKIIFMDESPNVPDYQKQEGHPIDSWLLYKTDGIFNTQEELDATEVKRPGAQVGDIKYLDMNDDKKIDDLDKVRLYESPIPKVIFGLNINFEYKGFELSMLWQGQADVKTYINPTERNGDINIPLWMYNDRWTPETAESATMPRAFYHRSESYNTLKSDFWLKDASFVRLKNLELAYNLPGKITSKVSIRNARIYVSGMNLLLFDKIKNYDPEIVNTLGLFYPSNRVYNIGVRITL
ncbi:MAG: TonB-dependent receptor [Prolixibacteraceae bacterium]|nr:TonB-dependent receptor [Prolixibacteraceae bacterium]